MNEWIVSFCQLRIINLSVSKNLEVDVGKNNTKSHIRNMAPRLANDALEQEVIVHLDISNLQIVMIGVEHVNANISQEQYHAGDKASPLILPVDHCNEWDYKSDLHIQHQRPCLLIASIILFQCCF